MTKIIHKALSLAIALSVLIALPVFAAAATPAATVGEMTEFLVGKGMEADFLEDLYDDQIETLYGSLYGDDAYFESTEIQTLSPSNMTFSITTVVNKNSANVVSSINVIVLYAWVTSPSVKLLDAITVNWNADALTLSSYSATSFCTSPTSGNNVIINSQITPTTVSGVSGAGSFAYLNYVEDIGGPGYNFHGQVQVFFLPHLNPMYHGDGYTSMASGINAQYTHNKSIVSEPFLLVSAFFLLILLWRRISLNIRKNAVHKNGE